MFDLISGWKLQIGESLRSRRSVHKRTSVLMTSTGLLLPREFQVSVRFWILLNASLICVRQTSKLVKTRARAMLSHLFNMVSLLAPTFSVPICVGDAEHVVQLTLTPLGISTPIPLLWIRFLEDELGMARGSTLDLVFIKLAEPSAHVYRKTGRALLTQLAIYLSVRLRVLQLEEANQPQRYAPDTFALVLLRFLLFFLVFLVF
jgi:hypothetical protein